VGQVATIPPYWGVPVRLREVKNAFGGGRGPRRREGGAIGLRLP
jgi:hypothetical protein